MATSRIDSSAGRGFQPKISFAFEVFLTLLNRPKNGKASYYRFLNLEYSEIDYVDINPTESNVLNLNLEEKLPIKEKTFNSVIAINIFEHIFNIKDLIEEIYRILDHKGKLIGSTPFIKEYHADPTDYYRYTQDFYKKVFEKSGFVNIEVILIGQGVFHLIAENVYWRTFSSIRGQNKKIHIRF